LSSVRRLLLAAIGAILILTPASTEAVGGGYPSVALDGSAATPRSGIALDALREAARATGLRVRVLEAALIGHARAAREGIGKPSILTIIDYSQPSGSPRLWVLDLQAGEVLMHELVAHGRGTGVDTARRFSNVPGSLQSSLGTFITGETYHGKHGLSLRLRGIDAGLNDRAAERAIVVHGAWYVSEEIVRQQGRLGRSEGCPALSEDVAPRVIELIRDGSVIFSYYPSAGLERSLASEEATASPAGHRVT
jgi:hypothetical protein